MARRVAAGRVARRGALRQIPCLAGAPRASAAPYGDRVRRSVAMANTCSSKLDRGRGPFTSNDRRLPHSGRSSVSSSATTPIAMAPGPALLTPSLTTAAVVRQRGSDAFASATIPATSRPSACLASTPMGDPAARPLLGVLRDRSAPLKAVLLDRPLPPAWATGSPTSALQASSTPPPRAPSPAKRRGGSAPGCARWPCPGLAATAIALMALPLSLGQARERGDGQAIDRTHAQRAHHGLVPPCSSGGRARRGGPGRLSGRAATPMIAYRATIPIHGQRSVPARGTVTREEAR
jgi:hypothetical protein